MLSKILFSLLYSRERLRDRLYSAVIAGEFAEFGPGCRVIPPFRSTNRHKMRLGAGTIIHSDCWFNVIGDVGKETSIKIDIGKDCGIGMGATISAAKSIKIGNHVLLARNVYISDHRHTYEGISSPIMYQGICGIAPVTIGSKTWLSQNVVILPGVTIGEHCVIGANSVVCHDVPDYSVAAGAPAKVIRRLNPNNGQWEKTTHMPC